MSSQRSSRKRLGNILGSLEEGDFFTIKEVLESKYFCRCFKPATKSIASSGGDNGEDITMGGATLAASNKGEFHHSREEPRRDNHSRDCSVEYIGTIRKEMRKILPRLPDLTLLGG